MRRATYIRLKRTLTTLLTVTLLSLAFYTYFHTGTFTIRDYDFVGVPEEYVEHLEQQVGYLAEQKLFYILPGNRIISFHDDEMRTAIMEVLPNTKKIRIYPSGLHTLTIKLTQHTPLFSVSDTHAISSEGVVYKEITPLWDYPRLEIASTTEVEPKTLERLANLSDKISTVIYPVRYVVIDEHNDVRLYNEEKTTAIITTSKADMSKVWSNVLSAIDTEPLKGKLSSKSETLEYLDTRFGNKVFYRFTKSVAPAIIPAHGTTTSQTAQ